MNGKADEGERLARAASRFIGTPFRLHGRNPAIGLDCVGLLLASLGAMGRRPVAPEGYRLRNCDPMRWFAFAYRSGLIDAGPERLVGDILIVEPGPAQQHLLIVESRMAVIHAHAGLGRVVRQVVEFPNKPLAHWRLS